MKRHFRFSGLILFATLLIAGCDLVEKSSSGGASEALAGVCDASLQSTGVCTEYYGTAYSAGGTSQLEEDCQAIGGVWSAGTLCSVLNELGACTIIPNDGAVTGKEVIYYYTTNTSSSTAQANCTGLQGTYLGQ